MKINSIYTKVRLAAFKEWDPIGVQEIPGAENEYDGYIPKICELIILKKSRQEIYDYLWWIETERMGLTGNKIRLEKFVDQLMLIGSTAN